MLLLEPIPFLFYDNSILPGTKIEDTTLDIDGRFYDNSILPGTKIIITSFDIETTFYDNSILPGTKMKHSFY